MGYPYGYTMNGLEEAGELALGIAAVLLLVLGLSGIFSLVCYILESLGLYTIAQRRQLKHPWMAWVPVANQYLLGCVSDQYQYVVKGKNTSRRKWLLVFSIVSIVMAVVFYVMYFGFYVKAAMMLSYNLPEEQLLREIMTPMLGMLGIGLVMFAVSIAQLVFYYIALYDLYISCDRKNGVAFLVLSIVFTVTRPFFVFAVRNKDQGMPPRKAAAPAQPVQESAAEPVYAPAYEPAAGPAEITEE